ncbi:Probable cell division ftsn transmembrane protein [plant metagenome]|uniref:Probable cell division ftsn transmembrane protein n=2 Tax=root TaxID=1 RepID=A0A1C3K253_9BURK|nr:SPOR domain-containing protein [Orrella dioscoreae]SBT25514.1 Probable cell division ftsn transmembrane protein [Orrella dioscoreae]SOE46274.1 Probable cell division ftsn transmembrane protein [Orrella dioscoreae]
MAKTTRRSSRKQSGGSTLYGVLAGLLVGLILAAGVAFYVTKAPMPFVDRATRESAQSTLPDPRNAPDPNRGLYGRDSAAGTPSTGPTDTAIAPLPGAGTATPPSGSRPDDLGALIATLPSTPQATPPAARPPAKPAPAQAASGDSVYFLQVGSYRVLEDAESLRARILLLGLPVQVQRAEVNGLQVNRVRVGPYARLDDMNRTRARLGEEKIESAVVRQ